MRPRTDTPLWREALATARDLALVLAARERPDADGRRAAAARDRAEAVQLLVEAGVTLATAWRHVYAEPLPEDSP